jgi:hypothetical protein
MNWVRRLQITAVVLGALVGGTTLARPADAAVEQRRMLTLQATGRIVDIDDNANDNCNFDRSFSALAPLNRSTELNPKITIVCDEIKLELEARGTITPDGIIGLTYRSQVFEEDCLPFSGCSTYWFDVRNVSLTMGPNPETRKIKRFQPSRPDHYTVDVVASLKLSIVNFTPA